MQITVRTKFDHLKKSRLRTGFGSAQGELHQLNHGCLLEFLGNGNHKWCPR
jgi:hypothetical protein